MKIIDEITPKLTNSNASFFVQVRKNPRTYDTSNDMSSLYKIMMFLALALPVAAVEELSRSSSSNELQVAASEDGGMSPAGMVVLLTIGLLFLFCAYEGFCCHALRRGCGGGNSETAQINANDTNPDYGTAGQSV